MPRVHEDSDSIRHLYLFSYPVLRATAALLERSVVLISRFQSGLAATTSFLGFLPANHRWLICIRAGGARTLALTASLNNFTIAHAISSPSFLFANAFAAQSTGRNWPRDLEGKEYMR